MSRRVYECLTYDTATATCTQAAFVERQPFPELEVSAALELLSYTALCFVCAWGWKQLGRTTRN